VKQQINEIKISGELMDLLEKEYMILEQRISETLS